MMKRILAILIIMFIWEVLSSQIQIVTAKHLQQIKNKQQQQGN